jgi:predicted DNA-binding transcriptional regulator AlpA
MTGIDGAGPELLRRDGVAELLGMSYSTVGRMSRRGLIPAPVRLGGTGNPLWRRAELRAWVAAGCPDRRTWERTR